MTVLNALSLWRRNWVGWGVWASRLPARYWAIPCLMTSSDVRPPEAT